MIASIPIAALIQLAAYVPRFAIMDWTTTVMAEIHRKRPDLFPLLFEPFYFDRNDAQGPGEPPAFAVPIAVLMSNTCSSCHVPRTCPKPSSGPNVLPLEEGLKGLPRKRERRARARGAGPTGIF